MDDEVMDDEVMENLAAAIRRHDFEEAEYLLDKLVRNSSRLTTAVSLGRYGSRSKVQAVPVPRAKAA